MNIADHLLGKLEGKADPEMIHLLHDHLRKSNNDLSKTLLGDGTRTADHAAIDNLQLELQKKVRGKQNRHDLQLALLHWIDQGNQLGYWDICPPKIPVMLKPPVSPFTDHVRSYEGQYQDLVETLKLSIESEEELTSKERIGQLFLSSILHGKLHDSSMLKALARQLGDPITFTDTHGWLDLKLTWRKQPDAELRRWFADPLSEILFLNLNDESREFASAYSENGWSTEKLWACIKAFLSRFDDQKSFRKLRLTQLIEISNYQELLYGVAATAAYSRKNIVCHSLKPHAWYRINGVLDQAELAADQASSEVKSEYTEEDQAFDELLLSTSWYDDFRAQLNLKSRKEVISAVKEYVDRKNAHTSDAVIPRWIYHLLTQGSAAGNKLADGTIRGYLATAGTRIIALVGAEDVISLGADGLSSIYEEVLDDARSLHHRRNIANGLREFHHFLHVCHDIPLINYYEVLGIGTKQAPVDANILSIEEYQEVFRRLRGDPSLIKKSLSLGTCAALIFCIGFRCGTRRMEVLRVLTSDLHVCNGIVELLIRPWANRRLKTKGSTRKIPLNPFLSEEELQLLIEWHHQRTRHPDFNPEFSELFGIPEIGMHSLEENYLFGHIHRVMREVTGDSSLRFHHLRHSFGTWTTLRLFLSDQETIPNVLPHLPETQKWLNDSNTFRESLYGHDQITRKHLYAVASLLGHSGPDMSLEHYVHCMDLISTMTSIDRPGTPNIGLLHLASNLPRRTIYNNELQDDPSALLQYVRTKKTKEGRARLLESKPFIQAEEKSSDLELSGHHLYEKLWLLLNHYSQRPETEIIDLARTYGYPPDQIDGFLEQADYIARHSSHFPLKLNARLNQYADEDINSVTPRWPWKSEDRTLFKSIAGPMMNLVMRPSTVLSGEITVDAMVEYFIEHFWLTRNELLFKSESDARFAAAYLKLLSELGFKRSQIEIRTYKGVSRETKRWWREALNLTAKDRLVNRAPPGHVKGHLRNAIGIKPMVERTNEPDSGSDAIRFLFHLSSVFIRGNEQIVVVD